MNFLWKAIGIAILPAYLLITIVIGWASQKRVAGSNDFLNASRSLPLWVVSGAFLSANCGALEIVGLSAVAAQYGVQAFHFYWIGAIPAMVFLGGVFMPIYLRSGVRSLPEYLEKRYDARVRLINAWLVLCMITALSGIEIYAMAEVLGTEFQWRLTFSACLCAGVVLAYVVIGGLRATVYNELLQLAMIVAGLFPLLLRMKGPFSGFPSRVGPHWHLWLGLPLISRQGNLDQFGVIAGLGMVLSFSYWCTDFVQIQRALTARTLSEARMVPLLAGFGKLGFSMLIIVPALGASAYLAPHVHGNYNETLPALMGHFYGPVSLGLGMTALFASLMAGLAANVAAFSSIWTQEIYRPYLHKGDAETHYIRVGQAAAIIAAVLSLAASCLTAYFRDLMEYIQLVFSLCAAPFFAIFVMGMFTRRANAFGAIVGLFSGVGVAASYHIFIALGWIPDGSLMSTNFHVAIYAFLTAFIVGLLASNGEKSGNESTLSRLVYDYRGEHKTPSLPALWWAMAFVLLAACAALNYIWR